MDHSFEVMHHVVNDHANLNSLFLSTSEYLDIVKKTKTITHKNKQFCFDHSTKVPDGCISMCATSRSHFNVKVGDKLDLKI